VGSRSAPTSKQDAAALRSNPRERVNGLRSLRNQVHRYLALSHATRRSDRFPTFMARAAEVDGLVTSGWGSSPPGLGRSPTTRPFPDGADIGGPHRLVGLDLLLPHTVHPLVEQNPSNGATPAAREDALDERINC
jgi:hypothetical protein